MRKLRELVRLFAAVSSMSLLSFANYTYAAPQDDIMQRQQQVLQQQQQDFASKRAQAEMQQRVSQSMAKTQQQGARLEVFSLPEEEKAFEISNFYLKADKYAGKFEWINKYLDNYNGHKIGVKGINMLMQAINGEIMNRGYVTTRVYVEEQDLSTGNFFFTLLPKMNTMNACMKSTKNLPVFSAAQPKMFTITATLMPLSVPIFPAAA